MKYRYHTGWPDIKKPKVKGMSIVKPNKPKEEEKTGLIHIDDA